MSDLHDPETAGLGPLPPTPAVPATPARAWLAGFEQHITVTLPSGRTCVVKPLRVVSELLAKTLPNRVLEQVVFGKRLEEGDRADTIGDYILGMVNIAVRALVSPQMVMFGEPDETQITPADVTLGDLTVIRQIAIWDQLPEVADAPFHDRHDDRGGTSGS